MKKKSNLDYSNGTSQTVSRTTCVTHCSIPRMHLDMSKWADMGAAVSCPHFLVEQRAVAAGARRAGEGRRTIYAKMGGL